MATGTLLRDPEQVAIDLLRARAESLMPLASDPNDAVWEASDGTLRTLPDITDHAALSAVTAALGWTEPDVVDPESSRRVRDALETLVQRLDRRSSLPAFLVPKGGA